MKPSLEVVQIPRGESFAAWSHGGPSQTPKWHFHPEYEIHLAAAANGRFVIGDFIGAFEPGTLVLTGPNLPHNWIPSLAEETGMPDFQRVIHFTDDYIQNVMRIVPELASFSVTLERSRRGLLFSPETSRLVAPMMEALISAKGIRRVELFCAVLGGLESEKCGRTLASASYAPNSSDYMSLGINRALAFIRENLTQDFDESDLARIAGQTTTAFSRGFRRQTGMKLVPYLTRLRINLACQLLMNDPALSITEICFQVGFNNLSNFNRQFLKQKGMPPSRFRNFRMADEAATAVVPVQVAL